LFEKKFKKNKDFFIENLGVRSADLYLSFKIPDFLINLKVKKITKHGHFKSNSIGHYSIHEVCEVYPRIEKKRDLARARNKKHGDAY
jgi:hypothetical protein